MKASLSQRYKAVRRAARADRWKLARRMLRFFPRLPEPSPAELCKFVSLETYGNDYARLAALLGREGRTPPAGEEEFLYSMIHRSPLYPAAIGMSEYLFLTAFVGILAPQRVVEIGTLTGFSAAIIAAALARRHGGNSGAIVDSIDARLQCLIDETQPTGFEIPKLIPDFMSMVRLQIPHEATFVAKLAKPNELEIIFIDADHQHPRVLLDVLRVAPYVRGGGWLILHDVELGTMGIKMKEEGKPTPWGMPSGAEWLFNRWPFRKISGGNIGAIQVPDDKNVFVTFALNLMEIPSELEGTAADRARWAVYQTLLEID